MSQERSKEAIEQERIAFAYSLLKRKGLGPHFSCLGTGAESVVVADGQFTYKVFDNVSFNYHPLMLDLKDQFKDAKSFIPISEVYDIDGYTVIRYPFAESTPYEEGHEEEIIEFLVECKRFAVACWDVKPRNFRIFSDGLKFIDYGWDIKPYNFKDYLVMAQRAYLTLKYPSALNFLEIARKALVDWEVEELAGFPDFFNRVYQKMLTVEIACEKPIVHDKNVEFMARISRNISTYGIESPRILEHTGRVALVMCDNAESVKDLDIVEKGSADVVVSKGIGQTTVEQFESYLRSASKCLTTSGLFIIILEHPFYTAGVSPDDLSRLKRKLGQAGFVLKSVDESPYYTDVEGNFKSDWLVLTALKMQPKAESVSLIIKACYQDWSTLERQVRHIVTQCEQPRDFLEKIVVVDPKKDAFLRQYADPSIESTYEALEKLKAQGFIDAYYTAPAEPGEIEEINERWFGLKCSQSHCVRNIPVTPQLFAFEIARGEYILQADCDVIVGRRDESHDYCGDMIRALKENPDALSVSFNIAHDATSKIQEYGSPGNGQFVPEVRFCMFDRDRLLANRPFPNRLQDGKLTLTWYRAMEQYQKESGRVSLRGGDPRTFYIHPQNESKKDAVALAAIVDRVERCHVPTTQFEKVELTGDADDWCLPKRRESYIFVIAGRNVPPEKMYRCWQSVVNQTRTDWGAIIIDDASTNEMAEYINILTQPYQDKVTVIKNEQRKWILNNIHSAIKHYCTNPFSVILILDADDMLIGNSTLSLIHRHYLRGADVTVGTPVKVGKGIYRYKPDFYQPRNLRGGDVWMHLRTFRKYLFDMVPEENFKKNGAWIEKFSEITYMIPIVEMASNPIHLDVPVYLWEPAHKRDEAHYQKNHATIEYLRSVSPCRKYALPKDIILPPGMLHKSMSTGRRMYIRHAEREKIENGNGVSADDVPLTPNGITDSRIFGAGLPVKIDLIISSPALRTIQTAENIRAGNRSNCEIAVLGCLRGVSARDREAWNHLKKSKGKNVARAEWIAGRIPSSIIEPFEAKMKTIVEEIESIIKDRGAENVLVVTHDHMISVLYAYVNSKTPGRAGYLYGFIVDQKCGDTTEMDKIKISA